MPALWEIRTTHYDRDGIELPGSVVEVLGGDGISARAQLYHKMHEYIAPSFRKIQPEESVFLVAGFARDGRVITVHAQQRGQVLEVGDIAVRILLRVAAQAYLQHLLHTDFMLAASLEGRLTLYGRAPGDDWVLCHWDGNGEYLKITDVERAAHELMRCFNDELGKHRGGAARRKRGNGH